MCHSPLFGQGDDSTLLIDDGLPWNVGLTRRRHFRVRRYKYVEPSARRPFWYHSDVASEGPQSGSGAPPLVVGRTLVVKDVLSPDDEVVTLYFGSILDVDVQTWTLHKWKLGDSDDENQEWWIFPRREPSTSAGDLTHWLAQNVSATDAEGLVNAASRTLPTFLLTR